MAVLSPRACLSPSFHHLGAPGDTLYHPRVQFCPRISLLLPLVRVLLPWAWALAMLGPWGSPLQPGAPAEGEGPHGGGQPRACGSVLPLPAGCPVVGLCSCQQRAFLLGRWGRFGEEGVPARHIKASAALGPAGVCLAPSCCVVTPGEAPFLAGS